MSTGLNCDIIERAKGEWYYVLEDSDAPTMAWDWREYATAYGPFRSYEAAWRNLCDFHANPGGYTRYSLVDDPSSSDEVLERLFAKATVPKRMYGFKVF